MDSRWIILAVLFTTRATMAFQFQSVGAVAPLLAGTGISLADIGVLIGLYFTPGAFLSIPGGAVGRRFGDRTVVAVGLLLMIGGQLLMAFVGDWSAQIAGRLIAGTGGVLLNVLMSKMVADWFTGREISTAMAIFVNSWPVGIGVSLLTLPALATSYGVTVVYVAVAVMIAAGAALFLLGYRAPPTVSESLAATSRLSVRMTVAVITAGLIWGLFNVGFAMIFSFGPTMLAARGSSPATAGSLVSIVLWLSAISVPLGGMLSDWTGRPRLVLVGSALGSSALLLAAAHGAPVVPTFVALGLVCGLPAGAIMGLPPSVLTPETRAFGMGLYYAVYYLVMMAGPAGAGLYASWTGSPGAPFEFGAAAIIVCPLLLGVFSHVGSPARRRAPA